MSTVRLEHEASDARSQRVEVESKDARVELVRRIVRSPTFVRSERLGSLLTYVCDLALRGLVSEINEHSIGHAVFGRSKDYDSSVDGIVRSQASRLRQRLELYFQQEGADEPVRVVIPRGGYVPVFEAQSTSATPAVAESRQAVSEMTPGMFSQIAGAHPRSVFSGNLLPWTTSVMLILLLLASWVHDRRILHAGSTPTYRTHLLWSHLFTQSRSTIVVVPDSGLVLFHNLSAQQLDLKGYLDAGYRAEPNLLPQIGPSASRKEALLDLANRRYTSIVDLNTILSLKDRAQFLGSNVSIRYARDLRPNDFKTDNVILLGASEADPWVELYEPTMNFLFENDYRGTFSIINRRPQRGEPPRWESKRNDLERRVFGSVAYLPSLSGDGNALLLEGTGMSGAEAGMDFVLDDAQLLPFLKLIQRSDGTLPHFELLLETHNIGSSAIRSQIVAWRTVN